MEEHIYKRQEIEGVPKKPKRREYYDFAFGIPSSVIKKLIAEASIPPHQRDPHLTHFICIDLPCQPGGRYVVTSIVKANRSWKKRSRGPRNLELRLLYLSRQHDDEARDRKGSTRHHGFVQTRKSTARSRGKAWSKVPYFDCAASPPSSSSSLLIFAKDANTRFRRSKSTNPSSIQQSVLANSRHLGDRTLNYVDWIPLVN